MLLSVGYGDLVLDGKARFFALLQAANGFLLPTALGDNNEEEKKEENEGRQDQGNRSDKREKDTSDNE